MACSACPTGRYLLDDRGTESEHVNEAQCLFCHPGTEFATTSTACKTCVAGRYQVNSSRAGAKCQHCSFGTEFDTISTLCKSCLPGEFQDQDNVPSVICKICGRGQYADQVGQTACKKCSRGKFLDDAGDVITKHDTEEDCYDCEGGMISGLGSGYCRDCPAGWVMSSGAEIEPCTACGIGKKSATATNKTITCTDCAAGFYQPEAAKMYCLPW